MLYITIPSQDMWDEEKEEFVVTKSQKLQLEHSLISLAKWESKWNKAFLSKEPATEEEILDYIRCMTLTQNVNPEVYMYLTKDNIDQIKDYINKPMTATTFSKELGGVGSREIVTAELIYYWMIALNIPFECQKWHLNRLLTLIKVCNIKNRPPKRMSKRDILSRNSSLNAQRRKRLKSRG